MLHLQGGQFHQVHTAEARHAGGSVLLLGDSHLHRILVQTHAVVELANIALSLHLQEQKGVRCLNGNTLAIRL